MLAKLAETLPSFQLPVGTTHGPELRQYQPTEVKFTKVKTESEMKRPLTTLVPDRSRAIPPTDAVLWVWEQPILLPEERNLLASLLRRMHYFGRAESWTCLRLRSEEEPLPDTNCAIGAEPSFGTLPVLVNASPDKLIERLLTPTDDQAFANRPVPLGTAWCYAQVLSRSIDSVAQAPRRRARAQPCIQVVRCALDSTVLPLITETLPVAEAARRALIYRLTDVRGRQHYPGAWSRQKHKAGMQPVLLHGVLTGKDEHRKPLTGHAHAYFLPTDEDNDGRIDHLTIVARAGFDAEEMRAMDCLNEIRPWGRDNVSHPLRVLMLGYGQLDEYHPSFLAPSREWVSATPYVATRHAKNRGRDRSVLASPQERADFLRTDLLSQISHVCADLDEDALAQITITPVWDSQCVFHIPSHDDRHNLRPIQFKRFRSKPGDDGGRRLAGAFRMILPLEVQGPMVLGWSSHFGMGLFVPAVSA